MLVTEGNSVTQKAEEATTYLSHRVFMFMLSEKEICLRTEFCIVRLCTFRRKLPSSQGPRHPPIRPNCKRALVKDR
jgi:hypothetical protein